MTSQRGIADRLLPSPQDLLLVAAILAPIAVHVPDSDTWWHLRAGELILQTGGLPEHDTFSFTASDRRWFAHEWLPEVGLAWFVRHTGLDGLLFLKSMCLLATIAVTWSLLGRTLRSYPLARVGVCIAVLAALVPTLSPRPWMFSFLFYAVLIHLWGRVGTDAVVPAAPRRHGSTLAIGVLLALWMNLHGMYVLGFVWLGLQALGTVVERCRGRQVDLSRGLGRPLAAMAIGSLGCLAHPYGFAILTYPLEYQFTSTHASIAEWLPPDPASAYGRLLLGVTAVSLFLLVRTRASGAAWVTFLGLGYLAFTSQRNIPVFVLGVAPFVAEALRELVQRSESLVRRPSFLRRRFDNFNAVARQASSRYWMMLGGALTVFFLLLNPSSPANGVLYRTPAMERAYPVAATRWIVAQPDLQRLRLFNYYGWGGYLLYAAHPPLRTFVDGRADLFGAELLADYRTLATIRPDWGKVVARHRLNAVLFPAGHPLCSFLAAHRSWDRVYADDTAEVFVRREATGPS